MIYEQIRLIVLIILYILIIVSLITSYRQNDPNFALHLGLTVVVFVVGGWVVYKYYKDKNRSNLDK